MTDPRPPAFLSPDEAGHYLGTDGRPIPLATLQYWRSHGRGPRFMKIGKRVVYARADLDAYRTSCIREPEAVLTD